MAGHSKWANIKHKKERADAKKGKLFSRIAKEIISAVKLGGADPKSNAKLRTVLQKAKEANVPNEIIERNVKKASSLDQEMFFEMTYELYGLGGVGIIVDIMTDNKNRIASEIRIATNKKGGQIANPGSVAFNFERQGVLQVPKNQVDRERLFLVATEAHAQDFEEEDEVYIIITDPQDLIRVKENLESEGFTCVEATLEMIPKTLISCDKETEDANLALIQWLEELDDVDAVYHNMDI